MTIADGTPATTARRLPPEVRRELRALERIAKQLPNLGTPGRKWLRDLLTDDLERRPD